MHAQNFLKLQIQKRITLLPKEQLQKVKIFVDSLAVNSSGKVRPVKLKGTWRGKGFEKIENLEEILSDVRKELTDEISNKEI